MKIVHWDAYRTFDNDQFVNRVFDVMVSNDWDAAKLAEFIGVSRAVVEKFFRYETVSLPTMLLMAEWACVNMAYFIIWQD